MSVYFSVASLTTSSWSTSVELARPKSFASSAGASPPSSRSFFSCSYENGSAYLSVDRDPPRGWSEHSRPPSRIRSGRSQRSRPAPAASHPAEPRRSPLEWSSTPRSAPSTRCPWPVAWQRPPGRELLWAPGSGWRWVRGLAREEAPTERRQEEGGSSSAREETTHRAVPTSQPYQYPWCLARQVGRLPLVLAALPEGLTRRCLLVSIIATHRRQGHDWTRSPPVGRSTSFGRGVPRRSARGRLTRDGALRPL